MLREMRLFLILVLTFATSTFCKAQRQYASSSVLTSGNWYQITISQQGIYKVDATMLSSMGITVPFPSTGLRLFGNGGLMLAENNLVRRNDDLQENSIWLRDGGDGSFDSGDFFLFYARGPQQWTLDQATSLFRFRKNLYSDSAYYYITTGGLGKRVSTQSASGSGAMVNSFDDFYAHELDTVNFLSSGKEWYGEEFGTGPGRIQTREFAVPAPGIMNNAPVSVTSEVIARSVGQSSRFEVRLNRNLVHEHSLPPLPGVAFEPVATSSTLTSSVPLTQTPLLLGFSFYPGSVNGQGWLNRFELNFRRNLDMQNITQLVFRDRASVASSQSAEFIISNTSSVARVWEITDPLNPREMVITRDGQNARFRNDCSTLREYISFDDNRYLIPVLQGKIPNQNLHGASQVKYIIIAHQSLLGEADRLGQFHRQKENLSYLVADVRQVYREFSSGSPDPVALRDFVKMFYDRAGNDSLLRPKYLLLFGDGSFDYRNRIVGNTNLIPAYESPFSLDPLTSYTSDDFFGLLDDNDDINSFTPVSFLDIGIGRIPAATPTEAKAYADKVSNYAKSLGPWRNQLTFVADDEDQNTHLQDAEIISETAQATDSSINEAKIYLDAYQQESGTGGSRYPKVNDAINRRIFSGNLVWNYNGHGGNQRLAQENILDDEMVNSWSNDLKLPLFITATCDFAPFDNPLINSIGENILLRPRTGGIALMTTTRLVFAFSNRLINNNYIAHALKRNTDGHYLSLGEAVKRTKNYTYQNSSDVLNNRKFTLLGDPAMTIGFPEYLIQTNTVNGVPIGTTTDTLKALNRYTITGEIRDLNGMPIPDFSGTVYPSVYDKEQDVPTLGNDPGSIITHFKQQQNLIYNGKAKVQNGKFSYTFIVPKDIDYRIGKGRISYYADNGARDASGIEERIFIGGAGNGVADDGHGPIIKAWLNDEKFVNGSIVNETPVLVIHLNDSSGINTVGTGIGHDITAVLDNNSNTVFVLNDFYEADTGSYQGGKVRFPLSTLDEGWHNLKIRAWDVFNNSSEYLLDFRVIKKEEFIIQHVLNYPNPFSTRTQFWFEHNRPSEDLTVTIRIMTITGKVVKTIVKTINSPGNRSSETEWDGRDEFGAKLGRGVYLYQLVVRTSDGKQQQKLEKLVIL